MKKLVSLVLAATMLSPINTIASEEIQIVLNGTEMTFEQKPFIDDGTTLVPMRAIFEALDSTVEWDGETRSITSVKEDITITMQIDSFEMSINDIKVTLEKSPIIVDDFTFVPLRAVAESFNAEVNWDGEKRLITIITPQEATSETTEEPTDAPTEEPTPTPFPKTDEEFAKMYEGSGYEFVRNLPQLTNDFTDGPGNLEEGQHYGWGTDYNGNGVFYVQNKTRTQEVVTEVDMTLDVLYSYDDGELYDISFDVYLPPANGTSTVTIMGKGESEILGISTRMYGEKCKLSGLAKTRDLLDLEINGNDYFNNNTTSDESNIIIENGAHVNILINPKYSKAIIKITNNSDSSKTLELKENLMPTISGERLWGLRFKAQHFVDAKPMFVDNIITNIVKVAE